MHSLSPVPSTITSYSSSMARRGGGLLLRTAAATEEKWGCRKAASECVRGADGMPFAFARRSSSCEVFADTRFDLFSFTVQASIFICERLVAD
jgi:hypothetical protein